MHAKHAKDLTADELESLFWVKYPDADKLIYQKLLNDVRAVQIDPEVAKGVLLEIKRRKAALKLSELSYKVGSGLASIDDLHTCYQKEFGEVDHSELESPIPLVTTDIEEIVNHVYKDRGFRWRLNSLNKAIGSLRKGDFGFIFARPETGKTTFLVSEISHFLTQGARIAWLNNEEEGAKVMFRLYQGYFGVTKDEILKNPRKYREQWMGEVGTALRLYDSAQIAKRGVERVIESTSPDIVVYDQLDKVKGFTNDREDLRLGTIYQWAREMAKGRHAAIGVCQANGQGEGVKYLTMEHVSNAQTAKQAEADWILGIGAAHDDAAPNTRYMSLCKNKLTGDDDTLEALRHGRLEVLIEPTIARYADVLRFN